MRAALPRPGGPSEGSFPGCSTKALLTKGDVRAQCLAGAPRGRWGGGGGGLTHGVRGVPSPDNSLLHPTVNLRTFSQSLRHYIPQPPHV